MLVSRGLEAYGVDWRQASQRVPAGQPGSYWKEPRAPGADTGRLRSAVNGRLRYRAHLKIAEARRLHRDPEAAAHLIKMAGKLRARAA